MDGIRRISSFLRLCCPNCGKGRLFRTWFQMHERCPVCALPFYPEAGYYTGSIYVNYGATVVVVFSSLFIFSGVPERYELLFFSSIALSTALALFKHSRSLWITIDFWANPWKPNERMENNSCLDEPGKNP